jgi:hypothetical protein
MLMSLTFASSLSAGLTPGPVVEEGLSLPEVADLDGNGLDDLIHSTYVLLNLGAGTFVRRDLGLEGTDQAVEPVDINGDGLVDLFAESRPTNAPPGVGSAGGRPAPAFYVASEGLRFARIAVSIPERFTPHVADVDGDGKDDLVLFKALFEGIHSVASEVRVLVSRGDGTFEARLPFLIPPDPQMGRTRRVLAGDVDRDGIQDLVIRTANELVVLRGLGRGDFEPARAYYVPSVPFGVWTTALADADGDGNLDVLMAGMRTTLRIFFGDGRGGFSHLASLPNIGPYIGLDGGAARTITVGNFLQAGRIEIALGTPEGDIVILTVENRRLREVSRTPTEFLHPDLHPGHFRDSSRTDFYVTWNLGYPSNRPTPRLVYTDPAKANVARVARPSARARTVRKVASTSATRLKMRAAGECVPTDAVGVDFLAGAAIEIQTASERVDAILDADGSLYIRMFAPWVSWPIEGLLWPVEGGFAGRLSALTSCGWRLVDFTASN